LAKWLSNTRMFKVHRHFLEIKTKDANQVNLNLPKKISISRDKLRDFNINKFFYKQIGIDHYWRDRLIWSDRTWSKYALNKNLETWIMKLDKDFVGFYEKEYHPNKNEIELINMGILKDYQGKKFGSFLLEHFIKESLRLKPKRLWVHTCSLDHKHALPNYKSKGFKVFKEEIIDFSP